MESDDHVNSCDSPATTLGALGSGNPSGMA